MITFLESGFCQPSNRHVVKTLHSFGRAVMLALTTSVPHNLLFYWPSYILCIPVCFKIANCLLVTVNANKCISFMNRSYFKQSM